MSWQGSIYATHQKYQKGATDAMLRKSAWLAMLTEFGAISLNCGGEEVTWRLEYAQPETVNLDDTTMRLRSRKNTLQPCTLPWAWYECTDTISKSDVLKNKNEEAIVKLQELKEKGVVKSLRAKLAHDFFIDGSLSELKLHGVETWAGYGSTQSNGVFAPSDTYAELSTVLQALGGSAPTGGGSWPDGSTEDPEYDCHSPLILSSTSSAFGSGTANWQNNCLTILSKLFAWCARNEGTIQTAMMTNAYWQQLASILENKDRVIVTEQSKLAKYGFTSGVVNYYGMECVMDYYCGNPGSTAAKVVALNFDEMELMSLHPQLFPPTSEDEFFADNSLNFKSQFAGQVKWKSLRNVAVVKELGS